MKNIMTNFGVILFASLILTSCGGNSSKEATTSKEDNPVDICKCLTEPGNSEWNKNNSDACRDAISKEIGVDNWEKVNMSQNPDISRKFDALAERCTGSKNSGIEVIDQNNNKEATTSKEDNPVDICKCLTEPGNSEWNKNNSDACRDAISKEIGVDNWEKVNVSQNPDISRKFDALAERCTGSKNSGIEVIDQNNNLIPNIGTSSGYIWESINTDAQIYTTLAFDGLIFRTSAYSMNGKTNSEDFSKIIDLSGTWNAIDDKNAKGIISTNNVAVNWVFSEDFSFLTNNKGVVFKRIKVK